MKCNPERSICFDWFEKHLEISVAIFTLGVQSSDSAFRSEHNRILSLHFRQAIVVHVFRTLPPPVSRSSAGHPWFSLDCLADLFWWPVPFGMQASRANQADLWLYDDPTFQAPTPTPTVFAHLSPWFSIVSSSSQTLTTSEKKLGQVASLNCQKHLNADFRTILFLAALFK